MTETPIPQQSEKKRRLRSLIISLTVVICASVISMFMLNISAIAPISVLILAAILLFAFFYSRQEGIKSAQQINGGHR
jgi:Ca2+/Na+ antiporter